MSFDSNNGTQYYYISCDVSTDVGWDIDSNNGSAYYYRESNDYILWGTDTVLEYQAVLPTYLYYEGEMVVFNGEPIVLAETYTLSSNVPPTSNNFTYYYFLPCNVETDTNWDALSNNGTAFYYNSAFNCVPFCE